MKSQLITTRTIFAWFPVKLETDDWAWLTHVEETEDCHWEYYLGLLPEYAYRRIPR